MGDRQPVSKADEFTLILKSAEETPALLRDTRNAMIAGWAKENSDLIARALRRDAAIEEPPQALLDEIAVALGCDSAHIQTAVNATREAVR